MASNASPSVFAIGSTGFIGGAALHGIHKRYPASKVSALVRSEADDEAVSKAFGNARIIRGSFDDLDLIEEESSKADFVLNAADADGLEVVQAILKGLKKRYDADKSQKAVFIQTSGTSVIAIGNNGTYDKKADKLVNDASEEDIKSIGENQPHRNVDLAIFEANTQGYVNAYIIAPSAIYGTGSGPVRKQSAQIPEHIRVAAKRSQVVQYGDGTNEWNFVHIDDLEELYGLVASLALSGTDKADSFGRFYFGSGEIHPWGKVIKELVPLLKARNKITKYEVGTVTLEEEKGPRGYLPSTGTNSRSKADRGIALGWKPRKEGVWETLEETVDAVIAEHGL